MALTKIRAESRFACIKAESLSYRFHLNLETGNNYEGLSEIEFVLSKVPEELALDCKAKEIKKLIINYVEIKQVNHKDGFLYLNLQNLKQGPNRVAVHYLNKYDNDGNGCVSFIDVDEKQYLYTQFEPYYANRVFALFDQPDLKAPMQLAIIWPPSFKEVISNEYAVVDEDFDEEKYIVKTLALHDDILKQFIKGRSGKMTIFPKTKVLSTYLYCFVAGPYQRLKLEETYNNIPMSLYCIESLFQYMKDLAPFIFEITIECMKFFEKFFGVPFSFNKYDQVFAHQYKCGAMENAGIVTFNDLYIWKQKVSTEKMLGLANTISHQLSHHWFGNLVTMKWWDDLWLNESFADFISHFSLEKIKNNLKTISYESSMASFLARKAWGYHEDQLVTTHPISGQVANTIVADSIFDGITYSKGASTMKQLLFLMSQENFSAGLKDYFEKYAFKNATLTQFIAELQKHFKHQGFTLEQWKEIWLKKASLNQLEPVWNAQSNNLTVIQTPVTQTYPTLRPHKIKIAFFKENCDYDTVDALIKPQKETKIQFDAKKYKAVLLNYEDHTFAKVVIDSASLSFFSHNLDNIKDTLTRTLVWRSFFDMVKDGIISSTKYIDIFVANIEGEISDGIFERHFDYIFTSINTYTPEKYREELNTRFFYFILGLLPRIKTQNRLVILRQKLVQFARTELAVRILISWRKGTYQLLKDHKMSVGQQWSTVIKAFSHHGIDQATKDALLADQSALDQSDVSKLKTATCKSLSADIKQFEEIYNSLQDPKNEQSITTKRAIASGWNSRYHAEKLLKYKQRYFQDITNISKFLDGDHFQLFVEQLEPIDDDLAGTIKGFETVKLEGEKFDKSSRDILKMIDNLKRRLRAYEAFEKSLSE